MTSDATRRNWRTARTVVIGMLELALLLGALAYLAA